MRERGIGLITGEIGSGQVHGVTRFRREPGSHPRPPSSTPPTRSIGITGLYREVLGQLGEPVPMLRQQMVLASSLLRRLDQRTQEDADPDRRRGPPARSAHARRVTACSSTCAWIPRSAAALVLVGHSEFRRTLRLSIHEALWQRTTVRYHFAPWILPKPAPTSATRSDRRLSRVRPVQRWLRRQGVRLHQRDLPARSTSSAPTP